MPRTLVRLAALAGALLLGIAVAPPPAAAGKVAVLSVQGDPEGELEDGLVSIVEDRHELVTSGEFERTARRAGLDDLDAKGIGKIAKKLHADAVVEGVLSREDEGFTLIVRIRAQNGKTVKKITVDLAKARLSSKAKRRLGTGILDGIDKVLGVVGDDDGRDDDDDDDADDDGGRKRKKVRKAARDLAADEDRPRKGKKASRSKRHDDDEDSDADADADDDDDDGDGDRVAVADDDDDDDELEARDDGERRRPRDPRRPAIKIAVGPSAKARSLAFSVRPDLDPDLAPNGDTTTMVPGARVSGEVYPMALKGGRDAAANLGVGFEFDQTLTLSTQTSDAPDQKFPTAQRSWSVGVRYRILLGDKPTSPTVTVGAGYGRRAFIVDRSALPDGARIDFPDVDYRFVDPGLTVRLPLGKSMALEVEGKGLLFKQAGAIQKDTEYGGAKITGFEAGGGVEVKVTKSAVVQLSGSWTQVGFDFIGNGMLSNGRDGDLTTQDVGGAMDRYIGAAATLGVAY
ncbi:MAG: hypothetical protein H6709_24210 [Kofleriaceae bacterium]|nr:hypothetical protein [Kofleriaceae bacterium]